MKLTKYNNNLKTSKLIEKDKIIIIINGKTNNNIDIKLVSLVRWNPKLL